MKKKEALEEARRRWGPDATTLVRNAYCYVGRVRGDLSLEVEVLGSGSSWKKAFEDADKREKDKVSESPKRMPMK